VTKLYSILEITFDKMSSLQKINFLLFSFFLLTIIACNKEEAAESEAISFDVNVETAKDVEIIYSDSAVVRVKITGPTMLYHVNRQEPEQEFTDGVRVDFYGPDQKITSTLTGKYAIRYESKGMVVVRDSVAWRSEAGEKLDTEELIWEERQQRVYNHKFVVLRKLDELIYGHGFEATQDFKNARVVAVSGKKSIDAISDDFE